MPLIPVLGSSRPGLLTMSSRAAQRNAVFRKKKKKKSRTVVVHAFDPSSWEAEAGRFEFEASLVHRVSSRTAKATEKPCLEKKKSPRNWLLAPKKTRHYHLMRFKVVCARPKTVP
jgi:hypothetical protein